MLCERIDIVADLSTSGLPVINQLIGLQIIRLDKVHKKTPKVPKKQYIRGGK